MSINHKSGRLLSLILFSMWVFPIAIGANVSDYLDGQFFLDLKTVEKRWGAKTFSPNEFKNGAPKVRAQMAFSLIKGKFFVGATAEAVKNSLGNFTGYFWSNSVPAYLIEEGWTTNSDSWQVVFLLDDFGKVKELKIHKNCCN